MSEVTKRDLAVWSGAIGSALALVIKDYGKATVHAIEPDATRQALIDAKHQIEAAMKTDTLKADPSWAKAAQLGIDSCDRKMASHPHPAIFHKFAGAKKNLEVVVAGVGATAKPTTKKTKTAKKAEPEAEPNPDEQATKGLGRRTVACVCGKSHAISSKVLARHMAKG